jgi:hypothetical protein
MATSISFGLGFATMLVLFVVPVLLSYIEQFTGYVDRLRHGEVLQHKQKNTLV